MNLTNFIKTIPNPNTDEYIGDDGLLHCNKCGEPTECFIDWLGVKTKTHCICSCGKKQYESDRKQMLVDTINCHRKDSFLAGDITATFEKAKPTELISKAQEYVDTFDINNDMNGLLLYGSTGTGKTYAASAIANALIDKGYRVMVASLIDLSNEYQESKTKNTWLNDLSSYALLVLDDFGVERSTEYMMETVYAIINKRYNSKLPMIVTTNLNGQQLKDAKHNNQDFDRIYSRIIQRCKPIVADGEDIRVEIARGAR